MRIAIDNIRTDGNTQSRVGIDLAAVSDYAESYKHGARFPPVIVYHDGSDYWLSEGFHRVMAARRAEWGF